MVHAGLGERQLNSLLAGLNIPTVSHKMLGKRQREVGNVIEEVATQSTTAAMKEELNLVKE